MLAIPLQLSLLTIKMPLNQLINIAQVLHSARWGKYNSQIHFVEYRYQSAQRTWYGLECTLNIRPTVMQRRPGIFRTRS